MGLLDFFKSDKEEIQPRLIETPEQKKLKELIAGYSSKYGADLPSPYEPYGGRLSADIPGAYGDIDSILKEYLGQGQSRLSKLAGGELEKTLTGDYDPYTSPYYQSLRKGLDIETTRGRQDIRQSAQKAGMFGSEGRLIEEARLTGQDVGSAGNILATLSEGERVRRLSAVPYAQEQGRYEELDPTRRLSAIAGFAGIPGAAKQDVLDRQLQEFLRVKQEQKYPLDVAGQMLYNYQPTYMYPKYSEQPSGLSQVLGYAQDVGNIFSSFTGGGPTTGPGNLQTAQTSTQTGGGTGRLSGTYGGYDLGPANIYG